MNYKLIISIFTIFLAEFGIAQQTGEVHFQVDVDNGYFEIVINDSIYLKKYKTELPAGKYTAKVWSPGYITSVVDFEVDTGKVTTKYVKMAISNERIQFNRDYHDYRMKFHKSLTVPLSFTLVSALSSGAFMMRAYKFKKLIYQDIDTYAITGKYSEILDLKENIRINNLKYNRNRILCYTTLGITGALIGTTIFTYSKFKRNEKEPVLNSESPFKDRFSMSWSPFGFNLKYKLN